MLRRLGNAEAGIEPTWLIWDTCPRLVETIPAMQHDPHRVEDVLKVDADPEGKNGDDPYDGARYGIMEAINVQGDGVMVSY
jgi:phage terminase large subunit